MIGSDNVRLHLDTFHMNIEETDPLAAIEQALPHLAYFELDQNHRGRPDRGAIDFTPLLAALFRANYPGLIGVEAFSSRVTGRDVAAIIGIWRDMFEDGNEVARAGASIIRNAYHRDFHAKRPERAARQAL
jgi:D-psicose/D-tagatose/L-ribulose 3-epimerase